MQLTFKVLLSLEAVSVVSALTLVAQELPKLAIAPPATGQRLSRSLEKGAPTTAAPSAIDEMLDAIDLALVDRLGSTKMFTIMEGDEVESALGANEQEEATLYDLGNSETRQRFKNAGIQYLLVPTLEDFSDQTVDIAQGTVQNQRSEVNANNRVRQMRQQTKRQVQRNRRRGRQRVTHAQTATDTAQTIAETTTATQSQFDAHRRKDQSLRAVVRCRLYEVATGNLLARSDRAFATNRAYHVLAQENATLASGALYETAARSIAEWATPLVGESLFPIKVLDKSAQGSITINRGRDSGIRVGQVYTVYGVGKELKDPNTGEVLGTEDVPTGRVAISELRPRFSTATVLEDSAIVPGNILRLPKPR